MGEHDTCRKVAGRRNKREKHSDNLDFFSHSRIAANPRNTNHENSKFSCPKTRTFFSMTQTPILILPPPSVPWLRRSIPSGPLPLVQRLQQERGCLFLGHFCSPGPESGGLYALQRGGRRSERSRRRRGDVSSEYCVNETERSFLLLLS